MKKLKEKYSDFKFTLLILLLTITPYLHCQTCKVPECRSCQPKEQFYCEICKSGFFLTGNKLECLTNALSCKDYNDDKKSCLKCKVAYELAENELGETFCQPSTKSERIYFLLIPLSIVAFIALISLLYNLSSSVYIREKMKIMKERGKVIRQFTRRLTRTNFKKGDLSGKLQEFIFRGQSRAEGQQPLEKHKHDEIGAKKDAFLSLCIALQTYK